VTFPLLISTYARIDHLHRTINALLKNDLARETAVFVYSDAPRAGDEEKIEAVRRYLAMVRGFSAFHVVAREHNMGANANQVAAIDELLNRFGSLIVMEDDIIVAPGFLQYMNTALEKYKFDRKVFSVSAYCPPISIPEDYQFDVFFLRRFNGWGVGWWKDRFDSIHHITREEFDKFAANRLLSRSFTKAGGLDMLTMLRRVAYGEIDAGDVRCMYTQFLNDQYTLYPTKSLVLNIGSDGTGVHCGETDKFDVTLSDKTTFRFPDEVIVDPRIVEANLAFRDGSFFERLCMRVVGRTRRAVKKLFN
jgi:Glycosyl transferase family 2